MADDICFDMAHAREVIRHESCDLISLYPGKNGGIRKDPGGRALRDQHFDRPLSGSLVGLQHASDRRRGDHRCARRCGR